MPDHNILTGAELHEPKGVSTADSGTIYIADGAGSGEWKAGGGAVFGEMRVIQNAATQSLTIATDTTLNTPTDYVKVDSGIWTAGPLCPCGNVSFDETGSYLEVGVAGLYEVSFWSSFEIDTINTLTAFRFSLADSTSDLSQRKFMRLSGAAGDVGSISASGFAVLPVGAKVNLWVAVNKSVDLTPIEAGLTVILLNEGFTV